MLSYGYTSTQREVSCRKTKSLFSRPSVFRIADMAGIRFDHVVNLPGPFNIPLDKKFIHIRLPDDKGDDGESKVYLFIGTIQIWLTVGPCHWYK